MDQINNKCTCKQHPNSTLEFIQVKHLSNSSNKSLFYCFECITDDLSFKEVEHILINQIVEKGENQIIQKWPPIDNQQIIEQLIKTSDSIVQSLTAEQQIINYFSILKQEILNRIDYCQKKMVNLLQDQSFDDESILRQYQSISQVKEFRKMFCGDKPTDLYANEELFKQFLMSIEEKNEVNTQKLQDLLDKSQKKQQMFHFELPNQIKESIISLIDNINLFKDDLINQTSSSHFSDKIYRLISNKSNYCSTQFLEEMKTKFSYLDCEFKSISFENQFLETKQPIHFDELTTEQLDKINIHTKHLAQLKRDQGYLEEIQDSEIVKIMKSTAGKSLSSQNQMNLFEEWLIEIYPYTKNLNFKKFESIYTTIPEISLEKGNQQGDQKNLIINQNEYFEVENTLNSWTNCISNIIFDKEKKYIFRLKFERFDSTLKSVIVGLAEQESVHSFSGYNDKLCCYLQSERNSHEIKLSTFQDYGIFKDLNGKGFKVNLKKNEEVELRVCLKEQLLEILDYPNYSYRIGVSDNQKQNLTDFKDLSLYISLYHSKLKVILKNAMIVKQFPN